MFVYMSSNNTTLIDNLIVLEYLVTYKTTSIIRNTQPN